MVFFLIVFTIVLINKIVWISEFTFEYQINIGFIPYGRMYGRLRVTYSILDH